MFYVYVATDVTSVSYPSPNLKIRCNSCYLKGSPGVTPPKVMQVTSLLSGKLFFNKYSVFHFPKKEA